MPIMGGVEATKYIRNNLMLKTPIIALTANAIKGERKKYLSKGMDDYVSKPFEINILVNKIGTLLQLQAKQNNYASNMVKNNTSSNQPLPYSLDKLKGMSNGSPDFLERIVKLFIEETPKATDLLNKYATEANYERIRAIAHKMKPSIAIFRYAYHLGRCKKSGRLR